MKFLIFVAASLLVANAATYEDILLQEWNLYKAEHGKSYASPAEDLARMKLFLNSKYEVARHNLKFRSGEQTYELGINQFSDMTDEEVNQYYTGVAQENIPEVQSDEYEETPNVTAPTSINWIEKGAVTPIRNQGQCGSCYAFAALGALEGHHYLKTRQLVSLSPQNIVDCSGKFGNKGCNGGLSQWTYDYIKANGGVNSESAYPYEGKQGKCRFKSGSVAARVTGYVQIPRGSEDALKNAVANGPVSVDIDASLRSFQQYRGGIYSDPSCNPSRLGHAVLAVGYGTDPQTKKDYWLVKNTWGTSWGERGYVRIARNAKNMCGIATRAIYPRV